MLDLPEISTQRFAIANLLWWLFWAVFQTYILIDIGFGWQISIADGIVANILLGVASFVIGTLVRYYLPSKNNWYYLFISGFALAALSVYLEKETIFYLFPTQTLYLDFLNKTLLFRFSFALLMIEFRMVTSLIWYYVKDQQAKEARRMDTENMVREAELSKLRLQLQPHFLFNSLNSISALVGNRPEEARKMIQQLSDFLRGTLKKDDQQLVTLEEELSHLRLYLEIEKVRFGHRLNTVIESNDATPKMLLPSLLLQPIVENAIKFGLYDTIGDITIRLSNEVKGNLLTINIENPFDSETAKPKTGTGFGLNSIQRRLYLLYARNDLLAVNQNENIFTTTIKIPQIHV